MKRQRYCYVICELVDGHPSFRHAFFDAVDDNDAYNVGHATVRQPECGAGLNDYAFALDGVGKSEYVR